MRAVWVVVWTVICTITVLALTVSPAPAEICAEANVHLNGGTTPLGGCVLAGPPCPPHELSDDFYVGDDGVDYRVCVPVPER